MNAEVKNFDVKRLPFKNRVLYTVQTVEGRRLALPVVGEAPLDERAREAHSYLTAADAKIGPVAADFARTSFVSEALALSAALLTTTNLDGLYRERFPDDPLRIQARGRRRLDRSSLVYRLSRTFAPPLQDHQVELTRSLLSTTYAANAQALEGRLGAPGVSVPRAEWEDRFWNAWDKLRGRRAEDIVFSWAQHLARHYAETLRPATMTLEAFGRYLELDFTDAILGAPLERAAQTLLPVDHKLRALARHLAGAHRAACEGTAGYRALLDQRVRSGTLHRLEVRHRPAPELVLAAPQETLTRLHLGAPSELCAKLLLALFNAAVQAENPERFFVRLDDLLTLLCRYQRSGPTKTQGRYYWRRAAELTSVLLVDLAALQGRAEVRGRAAPPTAMTGYLFHRPVPVVGARHLADDLLRSAATFAAAPDDRLARLLRRARLRGFEVGFTRQTLFAFGGLRRAGRGHALTPVPADLFALSGPCFRFAYDAAFLQRWSARSKPEPTRCPRLLEDVLEPFGYLASATKEGRNVSYKDALRAWRDDSRTLIGLGVLVRPGVTLYRAAGGGWEDVTKAVDLTLAKRHTYATRARLAGLRVRYHLSDLLDAAG